MNPTSIMEVSPLDNDATILKKEELMADEHMMTRVLNSMKLH